MVKVNVDWSNFISNPIRTVNMELGVKIEHLMI